MRVFRAKWALLTQEANHQKRVGKTKRPRLAIFLLSRWSRFAFRFRVPIRCPIWIIAASASCATSLQGRRSLT